jgi:hypothetical protein
MNKFRLTVRLGTYVIYRVLHVLTPEQHTAIFEDFEKRGGQGFFNAIDPGEEFNEIIGRYLDTEKENLRDYPDVVVALHIIDRTVTALNFSDWMNFHAFKENEVETIEEESLLESFGWTCEIIKD